VKPAKAPASPKPTPAPPAGPEALRGAISDAYRVAGHGNSKRRSGAKGRAR
jgi:hypothetical protein